MEIELLCDAVVREYLARKGCKEVLVAFDEAKPRDEYSITNRRELVVALHLGHLVKLNKDKVAPYKTFLEMIIDYLQTCNAQKQVRHKSNQNDLISTVPVLQQTVGDSEQVNSLVDNNEENILVLQHAKLHQKTVSKQPLSSSEANPTMGAKLAPTHQLVGVEQAKLLDKLVFGGRGLFQEEWHQGFFFSDQPDLRYGLVQLHGGPCGIIAVVQAYVIKELVFGHSFLKSGFNPSDHVRNSSLLQALCEILWQAGGSKSVKVVLPPTASKKIYSL
jgi:hypothetical protein